MLWKKIASQSPVLFVYMQKGTIDCPKNPLATDNKNIKYRLSKSHSTTFHYNYMNNYFN